MSSPPPIPCIYHARAFHPDPRFAKVAEANYGDGECVTLAPWEDRSGASHSHEFAWLKEAWKNLPETISDQFPSPEHLRKRGLISAGYYNEQIVDAGTNAAAIRVAAAFRAFDDFCVAVVRGPLVAVRTAKSQSRRAMDGPTFQASKTALLETVAAMIGVTPETLTRQSSSPAPVPSDGGEAREDGRNNPTAVLSRTSRKEAA